jgi:pimeloyl-ACP methyl ester carboxylesterase
MSRAIGVFAALVLWLGFGGAAQAVQPWERLPYPAPMPRAIHAGYAPVNGIQLWYAEYGSGPPLILLHGGLGNSNYWGNQVPAFARHYRVITIDSRGHGRSTRDAQAYSYDLMASDVLALMDQLHIQKAAIVGWSDGGIIGLDIAIHHPERLVKLFAFGANADPSGLREDLGTNKTFNRFIARAGGDYRKLSKTPNDYDAFVGAIQKMWDTEPNWTAADLASIRVPVAIADGQYDEAIKRAHTEYMAREIPGAKLIILPNVSHFAMLQNPALFNRAVLEFLRGR